MKRSKKAKSCVCECHTEKKNIYHVRWKACCAKPVDGGEVTPVWGCKMKNGEIHFLIAKTKEEVAPYWRKEFGYDPIEETVDVATVD